MPAVCANGAGPSKPAFHPGLGVKGIILPPPDTSEPKQSAKSAAKAPTGTGTVGVVPAASVGKKFSYTEKRSAGWILQRHVASTGSNRSADWLKKVEWAKTVLPDFDMQSPRALDQTKRQRSQEAPGPSAKKSRVQQGRSFAQIAKERVLVGVLDQGNAAIPRNQWKWVETALATACFELLEQEPGPPPVCKDVGWFQGNVKVIACDDERSAELYKTAVSNIGEVYPGAKLVAVNWKDVPVRPRARLWIPSSIKEPERLLKMLQRCNPSLPTHDWKVAKIEEMPGPTNQAVMILNKESLAPIDAAGGELNFGFSSVHIRVYKSDATQGDHLSEKPSEEEIADLEAPERPELDGYTSDASTITRDLSALCKMGEMELTSDVASDDEDANTTVVEAASAALLLRLAGNGADIALIQEPWIVGGKVSGLRAPEYKLIVAESQGNIRTCILARKHLSIFLLHSFSNEDNTAVSLELQSAPIRLLSCYMAYDQPGPPPEDITRRLVNDCVTNNIGLLIGCDVNAHHTQWGSTNINKRGELLLDYILTTNLEVLNRGNDPTFVIKDRKEVIDLTLASHSISDLINNWKVSSEHSFSDHRAVTSTLGSSTLTRLLRDIEGGGCQLVAYADDVAMIFTGKYPQTLCDLMTVKLSNLASWADKCGLGVNPDKTELVLFTRRYKVPTLIPPKLKDSALSFSDSAKYLGLVLDKKLDWNQSTHDRCRKATIALYTCRKAIGIKWGMSPYIVRWLYTAIIRPILLYGILVWWPALSKQSIKKQINKVQRMAEICITGALNTTPNDALDAILNFPPIQLTSQAVATLAAIRIRDTDNWGDFHSGHSLILKENAIVPPKTDCCVPTEHVTTPFNVIIPRREDWITEPPGHSNALSFYTDGSKLNNQVGGGVFSQKLCINHSFRLPDHCSVFQAEILAIDEALIFLKKSQATPGKVNIYSDSQAAIKSIASTTSKSTSVSKCRRSLHEMAELFDICLVWVPGHQDIQGNCIADELARRGTTDILLPDKEDISMPLATCKLMLHNLFEERHNVQWYSTPNCRVARQTWPHIDRARSKTLCNLSRTDCSRVVRSITGHWLVGVHALRLKAPYNDFCRSCRDEEEEESPEHFFCFCPALSNRRRRALGKPFLTSLGELATLAPSRIALFVKLSNWAPF
ncbi:hypothetical protein ACLKA7_000836 [Drosophila subpalustris]